MTRSSIAEFAHGVASSDRPFEAFLEHGHLGLLPLLEFPFAEVQASFRATFLAAGVTEAQLSHASLTQVALTGLSGSASTGWASLAVSWLGDGMPLDSSLCNALLLVSQDKRYSQQTRHKAFALARRWQKSQ